MKLFAKDNYSIAREYFLKQNSFINVFYKRGVFDDRTKKLTPLLLSCVEVANSIVIMGDKKLLNQSIIISRAYIERLINYAYLLVCDDDEFERFSLYTYKKGYKYLDNVVTKQGVTFGIKCHGIEHLHLKPEVGKAFETFTSPKSGKDITSWTTKSIDQRIEILRERSKIAHYLVIVIMQMYYSDASEALHGTMYGCLFHTGIFDPSLYHADRKELNKHLKQTTAFLYYTMGTLLETVFEVINEKNNITDILEDMKKDLGRMTEIFKNESSDGIDSTNNYSGIFSVK